MILVRSIVAAAFGFAASCVLANVEVVDRPVGGTASDAGQIQQPASSHVTTQRVTTTTVSTEDVPSGYGQAASSPITQAPTSVEAPSRRNAMQPASANSAAEMFYQMQVMQQELLELRGSVEEQAHQLKRLKQQRLDDYVDLDRRLSALGAGQAAPTANHVPTPASSSTVDTGPVSGDSEKAHYQKAIDPIIGSTKDLDLAISLLHEHLQRYPSGRFAGNAKYWLGESYLVKGKLSESRKWFEALLNDYPLHGKVPAAKFKLGIVYHKLGMNAQSKMLLEEVRNAGGPAASRASDYLDSNF